MDEDGEPAGTTLETLIKKLVSDDQRLLRATDGAGGGSAPPAGAATAGQRRPEHVPWETERSARRCQRSDAQAAHTGIETAKPVRVALESS